MTADISEVQRMFSREHDGAKWDDMYAPTQSGFEATIFRERRDLVVELLAERFGPEADLLDLGCGAGPLVTALAQRGYDRCVAGDLSMDMLRAASRRLSPAGGGRGLLQVDSQRLPFGDDSFDGIACLGLISYVPDRSQALAEIRRVLRPGGLLILTYRNRFSKIAFDPARAVKYGLTAPGAGARRAERVARDEPGAFLDLRYVRQLLGSEGFEIERSYGIGFGPVRFRGKPVLGDRPNVALDRVVSRVFQALRRPGTATSDVVVTTCRRAPGSREP